MNRPLSINRLFPAMIRDLGLFACSISRLGCNMFNSIVSRKGNHFIIYGEEERLAISLTTKQLDVSFVCRRQDDCWC